MMKACGGMFLGPAAGAHAKWPLRTTMMVSVAPCLMAAAVSVSSAAEAGDHHIIASSSRQIMLADPSAIVRTAPNKRSAWTVGVRAPGKQPRGVGYVQMLAEYDCAGRTMQVQAMIIRTQQHALLDRSDMKGSPMPIEPRSQGEAALDFACRDGRGLHPGTRIAGASLRQAIDALFDGPWPGRDP